MNVKIVFGACFIIIMLDSVLTTMLGDNGREENSSKKQNVSVYITIKGNVAKDGFGIMRNIFCVPAITNIFGRLYLKERKDDPNTEGGGTYKEIDLDDLCQTEKQSKTSQCDDKSFEKHGKETTCNRKPHFILVIGGGSENQPNAEVLSLGGSPKKCDIEYPVAITFGEVSAVVDSIVTVCTGLLKHGSNREPIILCFQLDTVNNEWTRALTVPKALAVASFMKTAGYLVSRGIADDMSKFFNFSSDEFYNTDNLKVHDRCIVNINASHIILLGGKAAEKSVTRVDVLNIKTLEWTKMAPMQHRRTKPMCSMTKDGLVLVAGGVDWQEERIHESTEVLETKENKWREGPKLPKAMWAGEMLLVEGVPTVFGGVDDLPGQGRSDRVLRLNMDGWEEAETKMAAPRAKFTAVQVPGEVLPGCK